MAFAIRVLNLQSMLHLVRIQFHCVDGHRHMGRLLTMQPSPCLVIFTTKSGPFSAAGAWIVDGSPFRLSLRVREHHNQTDAHFEVFPDDLDDVPTSCCSEESCTRDYRAPASLGSKRGVFLSCFLLRVLVGFLMVKYVMDHTESSLFDTRR
jgi:hypothetical protein